VTTKTPTTREAIRERAGDVRALLAELAQALDAPAGVSIDVSPMLSAKLLIGLDGIHTELERLARPIIDASGLWESNAE
jgi:hypothetical protein